jgi:hypothetical protein
MFYYQSSEWPFFLDLITATKRKKVQIFARNIGANALAPTFIFLFSAVRKSG